jgi:hypothetical protein
LDGRANFYVTSCGPLGQLGDLGFNAPPRARSADSVRSWAHYRTGTRAN